MPTHTIKRKQWTVEEDNLLRELLALKKYSFREISLRFPGTNADSVRKHALVHLGLTNEGHVHKKHSYNQNFFETPNPINCYVAGYYAADGHIADNPTTRLVAIQLAPPEKHQLETFKRLLEYTGPVVLDRYDGRFDIYALRLYGAHKLSADLEKNFGLTKNKTHRLPAPNLTDEHLKLCYLAGLLDGDGCVGISNTNQVTINYTSCSLTIVEWVRDFVESMNLPSIRKKAGALIRKHSSGSAHTYQVCGLKALHLIRRIQKLKLEGIPILGRKWDNERINAYIKDFEQKFSLPPIN